MRRRPSGSITRAVVTKMSSLVFTGTCTMRARPRGIVTSLRASRWSRDPWTRMSIRQRRPGVAMQRIR